MLIGNMDIFSVAKLENKFILVSGGIIDPHIVKETSKYP
jgi:hypothetical protein